MPAHHVVDPPAPLVRLAVWRRMAACRRNSSRRLKSTAPLERMSSVPVSCSSTKPNRSASAWRRAFWMGHGQIAHAVQRQQGHGGEEGEGQPGAPVLAEQGHQDPDQQQAVADQGHHELREEGGHLGHIAVDALDQLAGGVVVVETHIQVQAVPGQLGAQGVGRRPGHVFAQVGDADSRPPAAAGRSR